MTEQTTSNRQWMVGEISKRADGSEWVCIKAAWEPWIDKKGKPHYSVEFLRRKKGVKAK